jgi:hypothetical protein
MEKNAQKLSSLLVNSWPNAYPLGGINKNWMGWACGTFERKEK